MCVCVLSCVRLFATLWTVACPASLSVEFSRQEYCSRLLFLTPGDLPDPGIEPTSLALAGRFFTPEPPGTPIYLFTLGCTGSSLLCSGFFCGEWELLLPVFRRLLITVASLVAKHGL